MKAQDYTSSVSQTTFKIAFKKLTPNSTTRASIILPTTVTKSKVFQGSLKKFFYGNNKI